MMTLLEGDQLTPLVCAKTASLRETLVRLNRCGDVFQIVVDEAGQVAGTLTDGDVRRALLSGATIDDTVATFMNASPTVGPADDIDTAQQMLGVIRSVVKFLPLVDQKGELKGILVRRRRDDVQPVALIMAGGKGTRLGDRTRQTPKPLLHVKGRPILEHVISLVELAGIQKIYISAHYLAEQIEQYCSTRRGAARLTVLHETSPYGTAGALALLPRDSEESVLVINGDVVSNVDLAAMKELHRDQNWDATIAVARHEFEIPYGVVRADRQALFLGIDEKPKQRHFVSAGIYLLNDRLRRFVPRNQRIDMPDVLEMGRAAGLRIGVFPLHEHWRDVGRPADLEAANRERPPGE